MRSRAPRLHAQTRVLVRGGGKGVSAHGSRPVATSRRGVRARALRETLSAVGARVSPRAAAVAREVLAAALGPRPHCAHGVRYRVRIVVHFGQQDVGGQLLRHALRKVEAAHDTVGAGRAALAPDVPAPTARAPIISPAMGPGRRDVSLRVVGLRGEVAGECGTRSRRVVRVSLLAHWQSGTHWEYASVRMVHELSSGQHASAVKALPPHCPQAPVAQAAASMLPPSVAAPPLGKTMRTSATIISTPSAAATSDFSLPEARSHDQRALIAPESRPLSLESSYPSIPETEKLWVGRDGRSVGVFRARLVQLRSLVLLPGYWL